MLYLRIRARSVWAQRPRGRSGLAFGRNYAHQITRTVAYFELKSVRAAGAIDKTGREIGPVNCHQSRFHDARYPDAH